MTLLTYAERLLLYSLIDRGPTEDEDTIECRVLVNCGLAERFAGHHGAGMIRVTDAGVDRGSSRYRPIEVQHSSI